MTEKTREKKSHLYEGLPEATKKKHEGGGVFERRGRRGTHRKLFLDPGHTFSDIQKEKKNLRETRDRKNICVTNDLKTVCVSSI